MLDIDHKEDMEYKNYKHKYQQNLNILLTHNHGSHISNILPGGGLGVGVLGGVRSSSWCGFFKPWKGPNSKHSFNISVLTSLLILIKPTAVPST